MLSPSAPAGFRPSGHGSLLVPLTTERQREVWTRDECKALARASKFCHARGVTMLLRCEREGCRGEIRRAEGEAGDDILRCDCTGRVLSRNL